MTQEELDAMLNLAKPEPIRIVQKVTAVEPSIVEPPPIDETKPGGLGLYLVFGYKGVISCGAYDKDVALFVPPQPKQWLGFHLHTGVYFIAINAANNLFRQDDVLGVQIVNRFNGNVMFEKWK